VGCTVAPGFNFSDFEIGPQTTLAAKYPQHYDLINKLSLKKI
jgi:predicted cupin superfamily sugar epimerase